MTIVTGRKPSEEIVIDRLSEVVYLISKSIRDALDGLEYHTHNDSHDDSNSHYVIDIANKIKNSISVSRKRLYSFHDVLYYTITRPIQITAKLPHNLEIGIDIDRGEKLVSYGDSHKNDDIKSNSFRKNLHKPNLPK